MTPDIPPVIQKILAQLNLTKGIEIEQFLFPRLDQLPRPSAMKGMNDAVQIIIQGIEQGTDFIIWGDYDVDGTTGTSLLVNFFRELGIEVNWHVPNRLQDGYGLHSQTFKELHTSLQCEDFILITVDCGISNSQEIADILAIGGKAIVTDHHQLPTGDLPGCVILNPNQDGCGFKEHKLAGVGVAFYLAAALRSALDSAGYFQGIEKPNMKDYLGFVALGTISDLVEITTANRILVRAGMESLIGSNIAGLRALLESAGLHGGPLTSEDISFSLGPRINAAGRLGSADAAVELMTCDNHFSGVQLSKRLDSYNEKRKILCTENLETALKEVGRENTDSMSATVVAGTFHSGVIGIVASKLVDIYGKPAIVFARETRDDGVEVLKGSGRSVQGIHLLECLHVCSSTIAKYGGHAMAAGLTITADKYTLFKKSFTRQIELQRLSSLHLIKQVQKVVECTVDDIMAEESLKYLLKLEPFGPENEKPVFLDKDATVVSCKAIGVNGEHLQLTLRGKYNNYRGIGFGLGDRYEAVKQNPQREVSFSPMINRYRGTIEWQVRVVDI
jgi:single-stranded-DNA-specific exonuclease